MGITDIFEHLYVFLLGTENIVVCWVTKRQKYKKVKSPKGKKTKRQKTKRQKDKKTK